MSLLVVGWWLGATAGLALDCNHPLRNVGTIGWSGVIQVEMIEDYRTPQDIPASQRDTRRRFRVREGVMYADGEVGMYQWEDRDELLKSPSLPEFENSTIAGVIDKFDSDDYIFYEPYSYEINARYPLMDGLGVRSTVPNLTMDGTFSIIGPTSASVPQIIEPPAGVSTRAGWYLGLHAEVCGHGTLRFQWYRDGQPIPGETSRFYTRQTAAPEDSGQYVLRVSNALGFVETPAVTVSVSGSVYQLSVGGGTGRIRGMVWRDDNRDGIRIGEISKSGVPIRLHNRDTGEFWRVVSASAGRYEFLNLPPGWYEVFVDVPEKLKTTYQNRGDNETIDSDIHAIAPGPSTAQSGVFYLGDDESKDNFDVGLVTVPTASFVSQTVTVTEGDSGSRFAEVQLEVSAPIAEELIIPWFTMNGTATFSGDYQATGGQMKIPAGQTRGSVVVEIFGDSRKEKDETIYVMLRCDPFQCVALLENAAMIVIENDDLGEFEVPAPPEGEGALTAFTDWFNYGEAFWMVNEALSTPECNVWRSGAVNAAGDDGLGGDSSVAKQFMEAGVLTFQWRVDSASEDNWLGFAINGELKKILMGDTEWRTTSVLLSAGDIPGFTFLRFDPAVNGFGLVKNIRFVPVAGDGNSPPTFSTEPVVEVNAGDSYSYTPEAEDPNLTDTVTITAPVRPDWLDFVGGELTGVAPAGDSRIEEVILRATDSRGASKDQSFGILVASGEVPASLRWRIEQFGADAANPVVSGDQADPDGDNLTNDVEGKLGLDPNSPDADRFILDVMAGSGTGGRISFPLPASPLAGTEYSVQVLRGGSDSDRAWATLAVRRADGTWSGSGLVGESQPLGDRVFVMIADPTPSDSAIYRVSATAP